MLLDVMKFVLAKDAPQIGDQILFENPKNFMYRIPRDMRYSKNKTPYNPAFRAYMSPHKKDFLPLSYYVHISHERCILETGAWPWETKQLSRLREHIAYNYEELDEICAENGLTVYGEQLKRTPRGYEPDHPAADWLKYKFWLTEYSFTESDIADLDAFADAAGYENDTFFRIIFCGSPTVMSFSAAIFSFLSPSCFDLPSKASARFLCSPL